MGALPLWHTRRVSRATDCGMLTAVPASGVRRGSATLGGGTVGDFARREGARGGLDPLLQVLLSLNPTLLPGISQTTLRLLFQEQRRTLVLTSACHLFFATKRLQSIVIHSINMPQQLVELTVPSAAVFVSASVRLTRGLVFGNNLRTAGVALFGGHADAV